MDELKNIMEKFEKSGWDLISVPAQSWLAGKENVNELISAIKQADKECGSCGCELDELYKRALILLEKQQEKKDEEETIMNATTTILM